MHEEADSVDENTRYPDLASEATTEDLKPENWASTKNLLGVAHGDREVGRKDINTERSIRCLSMKLEVYTQESRLKSRER